MHVHAQAARRNGPPPPVTSRPPPPPLQGARVHSDSWGSASINYDFLSAQVDEYCWTHPDFLPVFAAGNEGDQYSSGSQEVGESAPGVRRCFASWVPAGGGGGRCGGSGSGWVTAARPGGLTAGSNCATAKAYLYWAAVIAVFRHWK